MMRTVSYPADGNADGIARLRIVNSNFKID